MFIGIYPVFNELTFSMLNRIIPSIFIVTTANLSNPRGMGPAWGTPDNQGFIHTLGPVLHVKLCRAAVQCKDRHLVDIKGRNNRIPGGSQDDAVDIIRASYHCDLGSIK